MKGFTKFAGGFTGPHNSATGSTASYSLLIVGAGGGGGSDVGGGGGGGQVITGTALFTGTGSVAVTVGAGGGVAATRYGMKGGNSSVSGPITVAAGTTAVGGSGGHGRSGGGAYAGGTGYNGGGGSYDYTTSTTYSGGNAGSSTVGAGTSSCGCGGGGGSGSAGGTATGSKGGDGGTGVSSSISGTAVTYGGGGGGSQYTGGTVGTGNDGGGNGGATAVANRGGGGGGGPTSGSATGGLGGSGVVILSYPSSLPSALSYSGATFTNTGGKKTYTWTTSGSIAFNAIESPTAFSGLVGWYDMSAITSTQWTDKSGSGNHATIAGATVTSIAAGNGSSVITSCLYGSSGSHTVLWPTGILPATYTLFHVTRYQGSANSRIYTASSGNWLSGHWGGLSGQYYHEGWLTDNTTNYYGNNWFITTDQNYLGRTNGITRGTTGGGGYANRLCINLFSGGEQSYWQTVECIVYNRTLTASEYADVELYLSIKYGITLNT